MTTVEEFREAVQIAARHDCTMQQAWAIYDARRTPEPEPHRVLLVRRDDVATLRHLFELRIAQLENTYDCNSNVAQQAASRVRAARFRQMSAQLSDPPT